MFLLLIPEILVFGLPSEISLGEKQKKGVTAVTPRYTINRWLIDIDCKHALQPLQSTFELGVLLAKVADFLILILNAACQAHG